MYSPRTQWVNRGLPPVPANMDEGQVGLYRMWGLIHILTKTFQVEVGSERMLTPVSIDGSVLPIPPPLSLDPVLNEDSIEAPPAYTVCRGLQCAIHHRACHPYHHLSVDTGGNIW